MHAESEALGSNRLRGFSPVLLLKVSAGTLFPAAKRSARILIARSRRLWVSSTACTYSGWICWGEREGHRRVVSEGGLKFSSHRERNSGVQTLRSNAHTWGDADCFVVDKSLERRVHTPFASCSWLAGPPKHKAKPFLSRCKGWLLSYLPPNLSGDRLPGREQAELLVLVLTTYCGKKAKRQHPPRSSVQSLVTPQREPFQKPGDTFFGQLSTTSLQRPPSPDRDSSRRTLVKLSQLFERGELFFRVVHGITEIDIFRRKADSPRRALPFFVCRLG